jgi:hypothetical protein
MSQTRHCSSNTIETPRNHDRTTTEPRQNHDHRTTTTEPPQNHHHRTTTKTDQTTGSMQHRDSVFFPWEVTSTKHTYLLLRSSTRCLHAAVKIPRERNTEKRETPREHQYMRCVKQTHKTYTLLTVGGMGGREQPKTAATLNDTVTGFQHLRQER